MIGQTLCLSSSEQTNQMFHCQPVVGSLWLSVGATWQNPMSLTELLPKPVSSKVKTFFFLTETLHCPSMSSPGKTVATSTSMLSLTSSSLARSRVAIFHHTLEVFRSSLQQLLPVLVSTTPSDLRKTLFSMDV